MARKSISASELEARCSEVLDQVARGAGAVVVTRRGKPIAQIVSVSTEAPRLFGALRGSVTIHGDIVEPVDVGWEADE